MDYEFVIRKSEPETAKDRFLKHVNSRTGFHKSTYDLAEKLNAIDGHGTIEQLVKSGMSVGWFSVICDVCRIPHDRTVTFDINGGEYDYDICAGCLRGALVALEKE